ncbi:MAG: T9SS type A sorting domain-containing protein [Flavobacteriales bacterium]|nr:T9SS type A sorting domain-containing protein [Flavobacteriales bacterium]
MRVILTLLMATSLIMNVSAQEILNGGFEDWSNTFLYESPNDWRSGNGEHTSSTTTKVTMAPQGSYAVRMETMIIGNDSMFGFVLLGDIDDLPTNGTAFTTDIRAMQCWIRHELVGNDSALALLAIWSEGFVVAAEEWRFGGARPDWEEVTLTLPGIFTNVDSVTVAFASSDPFNEMNMASGSWLEVDDVRLISPTAPVPDLLPNHDFEEWSDLTIEDPDLWNTWNSLTSPFGLQPVTKSNTANSGIYSARIETFAVEGDTLPGLLTNGNVLDFNSGGAPYASIPGQFVGAYQYQPSGSDTARIGIVFKSEGVIIGSASFEVTSASFGWTPFASPTFLFAEPDTMLIVISSGQNPGSVLYVDDLDLTGGNVGIQERPEAVTAPYPNPTKDLITLPLVPAAAHVQVLDASGRMVYSMSSTTSGAMTIPVQDLVPGPYKVRVVSAGSVQTYDFVKSGT